MTELVFKRVVGNLPTSEYELMESGAHIGMLQVRHRPSRSASFPAHMASHVYYEIEPAHRNKGYGTLLLKLGLEEARKLGLKEVWLTCSEKNVASKKIIEKNGGRFMDKAAVPESGETFLKYGIALI